MELHQALRHIIQTEGADILNELRLLNILGDLNAFGNIQGSKYILRAIIADGFISQFRSIGAMNTQANNLITRFISNTGFDAEIAANLFNSIAYGLGWIEKMPPAPSSNPSNPPTPHSGGQQPNQSPTPNPIAASLNLTSAKLNRKNPDFVLDYCERACEYLNSIIEFKEDFTKTRRLIVKAYSNYTVFANPTAVIEWKLEIKGKIRVPNSFSELIEIVAYSHNGRILATENSYLEPSDELYRVITVGHLDEQAFKCVGNIGKIVIYSKKS